jgi:hypothetical protein
MSVPPMVTSQNGTFSTTNFANFRQWVFLGSKGEDYIKVRDRSQPAICAQVLEYLEVARQLTVVAAEKVFYSMRRMSGGRE